MNQSNIYEYLQDKKVNEPILILTKSDKDTVSVADVARILDFDVYQLPDIRVYLGEDLRAYQEDIYKLLASLGDYFNSSKKKILISPIRTILMNLPKEEFFQKDIIEFGDTLYIEEFKDRLYSWGYHFVDIVSQKGEVSFKNNIIDIFPINSKKPFRLTLSDKEIESIKSYDEVSQKSISEDLESLEVVPTYLALNRKEFEEWEVRAKYSKYDTFVKDIDSLGLWHLDDLGENYFSIFNAIYAENFSEDIDEIYSLDTPLISRDVLPKDIIPNAKYFRDLEVVKPNLLIKTHKDKNITVIGRNHSVIRGSELTTFDNLEILYKDGIVNIISKDSLIISLNKPIKKERVKKASIILDELKPKDYIVHEIYGVGHFKGIEKREIMGAMREFLVILYQNDDALLVPVENLEVIDRYVADGGVLPTLDKLGKSSFKKLRGKVKDKLFAIASKIINLSAQRHLQKGVILKIPKNEHKIFMSRAGFVHTSDQIKAIESIVEDISSGRMMDRLLSADVGFGKTEIAMNGMFIAVKNGYQSMMIAPTTLLSSQHFKSLKERFVKYDFNIEKLDRFSSAKEKKEILLKLEDGTIDMVVGTHTLLNVKFKKLGFVIIDEEHKFGVKQKERLKEMAINTHLLSMSATPIPRSLNLALSKIKTFSEILTPPVDRQGVRTFIKSYDEKIIKEAIQREIRRGGQIFYVYNSIAKIEEKRSELLSILPNLRIALLHSKISAIQTENEMIKFEAGEYDILLSTSIVESGIHIPSANSMIVDGANNFGIADLHQLRGRVGRGGKEGFCYFIVEDKENLSENSKKRLLVLESNSALGSGAVLAFHDLEIRGGGNIIGEAQSGHIKQIGYTLYLKMLEDTIRELSGDKKEKEEKSVDIKLSVDAYLNEELISEDRLRLELYRRLSQCETVEEVYNIEIEISDRFGKLDVLTRQFIDIIIMKVLAKEQKISKISSYEQNVFIEFLDEDRERKIIKSPSKDDDDLIATAMKFLRVE